MVFSLFNTFLPANTVVRNDAFSLRLWALFTLDISCSSETPSFAAPAIQARSLLRPVRTVYSVCPFCSVRTRWRADFHVNFGTTGVVSDSCPTWRPEQKIVYLKDQAQCLEDVWYVAFKHARLVERREEVDGGLSFVGLSRDVICLPRCGFSLKTPFSNPWESQLRFRMQVSCQLGWLSFSWYILLSVKSNHQNYIRIFSAVIARGVLSSFRDHLDSDELES